MSKKFYQNEKFQDLFFPIFYLALAVSIIVASCYIFKQKYYQPIIVDGVSMQPTLAGGISNKNIDGKSYSLRYTYGLADIHPHSVNNFKRFDVIVTYYPKSWGTDEHYKIKRVWGFPGEAISLRFDSETKTFTFTATKDGKTEKYVSTAEDTYTTTFEFERTENKKKIYTKSTMTYTSVRFDLKKKSFNVNAITRRTFDNLILGKNEYFVMGDNWHESTDCYDRMSKSDKLTRNYLQGRVLYVSAYVSLSSKGQPINFHSFDPRFEF